MIVKKMWLIFPLLLLLNGCGTGNEQGQMEDPIVTGLIYSLAENSMLVIEGIETIDISEEDWQGNDAISFSISGSAEIIGKGDESLTFEDLREGDEVDVWHTGPVRESYPMQADAVKVEVISSND